MEKNINIVVSIPDNEAQAILPEKTVSIETIKEINSGEIPIVSG